MDQVELRHLFLEQRHRRRERRGAGDGGRSDGRALSSTLQLSRQSAGPLADPCRAGAGKRHPRDDKGSKANPFARTDHSASAGNFRLEGGGGLLRDVHSLGILVMSIMGRVPDPVGCRFQSDPARHCHRRERHCCSLHLWDAVGPVEPGDLGRARDPGEPRTISLLALG